MIIDELFLTPAHWVLSREDEELIGELAEECHDELVALARKAAGHEDEIQPGETKCHASSRPGGEK